MGAECCAQIIDWRKPTRRQRKLLSMLRTPDLVSTITVPRIANLCTMAYYGVLCMCDSQAEMPDTHKRMNGSGGA